MEETTEATTTDGVTSDDTTEPDDTTTTTVTEIPGFGVSMAILVLISVVFVSFKRRKNKR